MMISRTEMSRTLFTLCLSLCTIFVFFAPLRSLADGTDPAPVQGPVNVAVLAFSNAASRDYRFNVDGLPQIVENAITAEMTKSSHFNMISRDQLPEVFRELKLGASGSLDPNTVQEIGHIKGVDYLLYGSVDSASSVIGTIQNVNKQDVYNNTDGKVEITVFYMKVATAQIVKSCRILGERKEYNESLGLQRVLEDAASKAGEMVASKLVTVDKLTGKVIQVAPGEGYFRINIGSDNGVSSEMTFELATFTDVTLPDGTVVHDKKSLGFAKPTVVDATNSKLEPGDWKKDWLKGLVWRKDLGRLKDKVTLGMQVITADVNN